MASRRRVESFATAALGGVPFHIDERSVVRTVAVLNPVFDCVDEQGAWKTLDLSSFDCASKTPGAADHSGRLPVARTNPSA
jgi:hypothetical protein